MAAKQEMEARHQGLCQMFADITGTDTELAVYYLEQRSWEIESAINMFFESSSSSPAKKARGPDGIPPRPVPHDAADPQSSPGTSSEGTMPSSADQQDSVQENEAASSQLKPESTISNSGFCLVTWNIDGLDERNILERTLAVCENLKRYSPDIVFLQEVVPTTLQLIQMQLGKDYKAISAPPRGYFTLVLLKNSTVSFASSQMEHFASSTQGRALQIVDCQCAGVDLRLICTHLESTGEQTVERKRQFARAVELMRTTPDKQTVIFGGDTNLRDKEVAKVRLPENINDLWTMCGSPDDAKFTWDLTQNNNLDWPYPNRPKLRFDRLYMRHAKTSSPRVIQRKFVLIGKERVVPCLRFPSDHWGILCSFKVAAPQAP